MFNLDSSTANCRIISSEATAKTIPETIPNNKYLKAPAIS